MSGLPEIPEPPTHCPCGRISEVNFVEVEHRQHGARFEGKFSEYGHRQTGNGRRVLRPIYRFLRWIPKCHECLDREAA